MIPAIVSDLSVTRFSFREEIGCLQIVVVAGPVERGGSVGLR
jgi:hypothetical protein